MKARKHMRSITERRNQFHLFLFPVSCFLFILLPARADDKGTAGVTVNKDERTITIDCKIAPRKINDPRYKEIYPIEVIACSPFPKGLKAHETVVTIDCKPSALHKALEELGLTPGKPAIGEGKPQGPEVELFLE